MKKMLIFVLLAISIWGCKTVHVLKVQEEYIDDGGITIVPQCCGFTLVKVDSSEYLFYDYGGGIQIK